MTHIVPTFSVGMHHAALRRGETGRLSVRRCISTQSVGTRKPMHEMSLCENILQILEQQAEMQQFSKVKTVWLEIGALSGVETEALRFSFDVVMQGSLAERAKLEIIAMPGEAWCLQCSQTVAVEQWYDPCPHCGSRQLQVHSGEQLRIKELEVE